MKLLVGLSIVAFALFATTVMLVWFAGTTNPSLSQTGCWTVVDVNGHTEVFKTAPQFDLTVRAIKYSDENHAGWIFPSRVDQDLDCTSALP